MNLWNLLALIAGSSAFGGSVGAAFVIRGRGESASLMASTMAGFVFGALASYALVAVRTRIRAGLSLGVDGPTPFWLRLLYGGAVVWIFVATYAANRGANALLVALRD